MKPKHNLLKAIQRDKPEWVPFVAEAVAWIAPPVVDPTRDPITVLVRRTCITVRAVTTAPNIDTTTIDRLRLESTLVIPADCRVIAVACLAGIAHHYRQQYYPNSPSKYHRKLLNH